MCNLAFEIDSVMQVRFWHSSLNDKVLRSNLIFNPQKRHYNAVT